MLDPDFLAAIGHPDRLRALVLLEAEPATGGELTARLGLTTGEAEAHLRQLAEAGLIEPAGDGADAWRTRATGWAGLRDLLAGVSGGPTAG